LRFDTLSSRIFAALASILVLLLAAAAVFGEVRIRALHREEIEGRLRTAAQLLAEPASDVIAGRRDPAQFGEHLAQIGGASRLRLTVVGRDGTVLADSDAPLPLANHASRPEIVRALQSGSGTDRRKSSTTSEETYYYAERIVVGEETIGFVRVAAELDEMELAIAELRESLIVGGLLALLAGLGLSAFLARWLARPLEAIGESARVVTSGDLDARIRADSPREVRLLADVLNSMADRLRQQIAGEQYARVEIETILASMAEGVVAVDASERVLHMNQAAARLLGVAGPLPPGAALWRELRFADLERGLREVLAGAERFHAESDSPRDDGRILSVSVTGLRGASGVTGAVALLADVTDIRRIEKMRSDFVANVSHELRTPLSAVRGALETLSDQDQDAPTRARFLDIAHRNSARLQAIVADLLELSTIEAQGDSMPLETIDVHEPLRSAAAALAGSASKKRLDLELRGAGRPVLVRGNASRLEQAFTNLIANAIQYTPQGGRITARVVSEPDAVRVEVEDTGIGIPTAALPRIFERFYRVDRGRSRDTGGTGLGLAIARHVALAHGGSIDVESEEGHGSVFRIRIPLR
jgi:two-component system, OmpR family, phosphate regulon sensor histidine kinase PhoR